MITSKCVAFPEGFGLRFPKYGAVLAVGTSGCRLLLRWAITHSRERSFVHLAQLCVCALMLIPPHSWAQTAPASVTVSTATAAGTQSTHTAARQLLKQSGSIKLPATVTESTTRQHKKSTPRKTRKNVFIGVMLCLALVGALLASIYKRIVSYGECTQIAATSLDGYRSLNTSIQRATRPAEALHLADPESRADLHVEETVGSVSVGEPK